MRRVAAIALAVAASCAGAQPLAPLADRLASADRLLIAGRHQAAAAAYEALLPEVGAHAGLEREVRLSLGRAQLGALRAEDARRTFRTILGAEPDERQTAIALRGLAAAHALEGRPAEARRMLGAWDADDSPAMDALRRMGRVREAAMPGEASQAAAPPRRWHWLRHGIFSRASNAKRLAESLRGRIDAPVSITPEVWGRAQRNVHVVHSGPYPNIRRRKAVQAQLKAAGGALSDHMPSKCGPLPEGC